ncbi:DUF4253 domain-containing protein [Nonomuraea cavernae]|uniref:DUF4253 domain-containing protein n=1 Tax=Nonomuraea cavernae TaxID=2045107 RepID=A0A917ZEG5_9ACTN|nr:DUF4253 domain-containing protein [Nonomuraea cavernae]MCA2187594.1 DUF4253 domain-containing protein [Nonomuraea cavernae]GGO80349.1 hypothetical protein GCM10012289_66810 [Nonomuraea cavernae]
MKDHRLPRELCRLFADGGRGRTLSVALPEGEAVWPDPGYTSQGEASRPAFWMSDEPATGAEWARFRAEHPRSGLWPVLLDESAQPWSVGQVVPDDAALIGHFTAEGFMAEVWQEWVAQMPPDALDELDPFGAICPGLAPPGVPAADPGAVADWHAEQLAGRGLPLGLVAAHRGADALAVMGWQGALHHNEWMVPLAAVVRSWEDRFGVRVVCVGFNTLELSVAAPPVEPEHALHVAAEHWAFCPDNVVQGPGDLQGYAEQIAGRHTWSFWWD